MSTQNNLSDLSLFEKTYIALLFFFGNILISPLFEKIIGINWKLLLILFLGIILMFILSRKKTRIHAGFAYLLVVFQLSQFVMGVYYVSAAVSFYNLAFTFTAFLFLFYDEKYLEYFIKYSGVFITILVIGAYMGVVYSLGGRKALFTFPNPDGRLNNFFPLTCTNVVVGKFIRPSGIYDEPGAFSFFICAVVLLRALKKKNDNVSFMLLFAGLITLSLTHLIVCILFVLHLVLNHRSRHFLLTVIALGIFAFAILLIFRDVFVDMFLYRIDSISDIMDNNRTVQVKRIMPLLDIKTILWGHDGAYYSNGPLFKQRYGTVAENPLGPLFIHGLIMSWIYYLALLVIMLAALINRKNFFVFASMVCLFLQRPYFSARCYSLYFVLFLYEAVVVLKRSPLLKRGLLICQAGIPE